MIVTDHEHLFKCYFSRLRASGPIIKELILLNLFLNFLFSPWLIQFPFKCMNHQDIMWTFSHNGRVCYIIWMYLIEFRQNSLSRIKWNSPTCISSATMMVIVFLSLWDFTKICYNKRECTFLFAYFIQNDNKFKERWDANAYLCLLWPNNCAGSFLFILVVFMRTLLECAVSSHFYRWGKMNIREVKWLIRVYSADQ